MRKLLNRENLIYATVFFLPAYLLRFSVLGFRFNALDALLLVNIFLAVFFWDKKNDWRAFAKKHQTLFFFASVIFLGLVSSVLVNKNYTSGLGIIKSWFLLPVLFSLATGLLIREDRRKNIFLAYYFSASLVAVVSLGYYFSGKMTYDGRLVGFFNSPNYLAMYLAPAIFIAYGLFFELKKQKKMFLISLTAIFLALYLTFSYASWLSIATAFGFVFMIEKKLSWKKVLVGIAIFLSIFFLQADKQKFLNLAELSERSSLSSRVMIWRSAEKILADNWFWGIGAGNFQAKYLEYQKYFSPYLEWAVTHPHNLYLAFWLYGGIFAFLGFLGLAWTWFFVNLKRQKNSQLKLIGLGIIFYILLHGMVDTTYFKNDLAVIFWLLFALV